MPGRRYFNRNIRGISEKYGLDLSLTPQETACNEVDFEKVFLNCYFDNGRSYRISADPDAEGEGDRDLDAIMMLFDDFIIENDLDIPVSNCTEDEYRHYICRYGLI